MLVGEKINNSSCGLLLAQKIDDTKTFFFFPHSENVFSVFVVSRVFYCVTFFLKALLKVKEDRQDLSHSA